VFSKELRMSVKSNIRPPRSEFRTLCSTFLKPVAFALLAANGVVAGVYAADNSPRVHETTDNLTKICTKGYGDAPLNPLTAIGRTFACGLTPGSKIGSALGKATHS